MHLSQNFINNELEFQFRQLTFSGATLPSIENSLKMHATLILTC
jgi:hypothetical protein